MTAIRDATAAGSAIVGRRNPAPPFPIAPIGIPCEDPITPNTRDIATMPRRTRRDDPHEWRR